MKLSTFIHESTRGWSSDFPSQQYDESLILVFGSPAYAVNQEVIEDFGERTDDELEETIEALPEGAKQIGFYSYGELSPYGSGKCDLHNQTVTLTTISEG